METEHPIHHSHLGAWEFQMDSTTAARGSTLPPYTAVAVGRRVHVAVEWSAKEDVAWQRRPTGACVCHTRGEVKEAKQSHMSAFTEGSYHVADGPPFVSVTAQRVSHTTVSKHYTPYIRFSSKLPSLPRRSQSESVSDPVVTHLSYTVASSSSDDVQGYQRRGRAPPPQSSLPDHVYHHHRWYTSTGAHNTNTFLEHYSQLQHHIPLIHPSTLSTSPPLAELSHLVEPQLYNVQGVESLHTAQGSPSRSHLHHQSAVDPVTNTTLTTGHQLPSVHLKPYQCQLIALASSFRTPVAYPRVQQQRTPHRYHLNCHPPPRLPSRIQAIQPGLSLSPAALTRDDYDTSYLPPTPESAHYAPTQQLSNPPAYSSIAHAWSPNHEAVYCHPSPSLSPGTSYSASLSPLFTPSEAYPFLPSYQSPPWTVNMAEQQAQQPTESPSKTEAPVTVLEIKQDEVAQEQVPVQPTDAQAHQDATTVAAVQAVEQQMPPDASYAQLQQDQWAQQQYYQVTGDHSLGADYSQMNVNGVMPLPGTEHGGEHYVADSDYTAQVAATLSNWHEANPVDQNNAGVMVGADGTGVGLGDQVGNGEVPVSTAPMTDKPKKLVLACHFCRGRKLKCDGARPTCGHCAKRSLTCTYDEQVRRRGPGKRTKEMRERAAREAEAAGLGLSAEQIAEQLNAVGSTLGEPPKKAGRKRKSETLDEAEKKARLMDDTAAAVAAAQAMQQEHTDHVTHSLEHSLSAHDMQHGLPHDMSAIDPSLAGADGVGVMDLPPLEAGTLGQVIQQLNGEQHQQQ